MHILGHLDNRQRNAQRQTRLYRNSVEDNELCREPSPSFRPEQP